MCSLWSRANRSVCGLRGVGGVGGVRGVKGGVRGRQGSAVRNTNHMLTLELRIIFGNKWQ